MKTVQNTVVACPEDTGAYTDFNTRIPRFLGIIYDREAQHDGFVRVDRRNCWHVDFLRIIVRKSSPLYRAGGRSFSSIFRRALRIISSRLLLRRSCRSCLLLDHEGVCIEVLSAATSEAFCANNFEERL